MAVAPGRVATAGPKSKGVVEWQVFKSTYKTQQSAGDAGKNRAFINRKCSGTTSGWSASVRNFKGSANRAVGHSATCPR